MPLSLPRFQRGLAQGLPKQVVDIPNFALTLEDLVGDSTERRWAGVIPGQPRKRSALSMARNPTCPDRVWGAKAGQCCQPQYDFTARGNTPTCFGTSRDGLAVKSKRADTAMLDKGAGAQTPRSWLDQIAEVIFRQFYLVPLVA